MTIDRHELDSMIADLHSAFARDHGRRRRRHWVFATAAILSVALASAALAGNIGDWWSGGAPVVQPGVVTSAMEESNVGLIEPDLSRKATVATTPDAQLVAVATKSGGYCLTAFRNGVFLGASCSSEQVKPDGTASEFRTRASSPVDAQNKPVAASDQFWLAYGRITDADAASLDLSSVGLSSKIPLTRGGFFLFDIPREKWAALDGAHGSIAIRDAGGNTLRTGCVYVGVAPGTFQSGGGLIGDASGSCDVAPPTRSPRQPDVSRAQLIAQLTLQHAHSIYHAGDTLALWQAPATTGGGTCTFWALAAPAPKLSLDAKGFPLHVENPAQYTHCFSPGSWGFGHEIEAALESTLVGDHYGTDIQGYTRPTSSIVKLVVVAADGTTTPVAYAANSFFAELPDAPVIGKGPGPVPGGPYTVVGYDIHGNEVASTPLAVPSTRR